MDTKNAPQIIEHISQSLTFTPFDVKYSLGCNEQGGFRRVLGLFF
jgi:hypothetical protein